MMAGRLGSPWLSFSGHSYSLAGASRYAWYASGVAILEQTVPGGGAEEGGKGNTRKTTR